MLSRGKICCKMVQEAEEECKKKKNNKEVGTEAWKDTEENREVSRKTSNASNSDKKLNLSLTGEEKEKHIPEIDIDKQNNFCEKQATQKTLQLSEKENYNKDSVVNFVCSENSIKRIAQDPTNNIDTTSLLLSQTSGRKVDDQASVKNLMCPEKAQTGQEPSTSYRRTTIILSDPFSDDSVEDPTYTRNSSPSTSVSDAKYTNNEKKLTRWKENNPDTWKYNVAKKRRSQGLDFEIKKKKRTAKGPKAVSCQKCRFKCQQHFSEEDRKMFCSEYWKLDYMRQKDFILNNCTLKSPERRRGRSEKSIPRQNSKQYYFQKNKTKVRICQSFFLKTLDIGNYVVLNAFKNRGPSGNFVGEDKRGKSSPANKTKPEVMQDIKRHIESFPTVDSHYSRRETKRQYLDSKLSITKMHDLYVEQCETEGKPKVSLITYKRIFGKNFNLSFFKPKKDLCQICEVNKPNTAENSNNEAYQNHLKRRNDCYAAKQADKERALKENYFLYATFDLQSVLQIPSSDVSPMYYSRKLCVYNLTVYESAKNAYCFCWTELNGKRGSSEIGTCLFEYLNQLPPHVNEVAFWSDTCGGQNRNQHVAALLMYTVQNTYIEVIEHKFLESGHSYMEADSMHSSIETTKKYVSVYAMNDWLNVFRTARSKRKSKKTEPYKVKELKYTDFFDLEELSKILIKNRSKDENGQAVNWLLIKSLKYSKKEPGIIQYKYEHSASYTSIHVLGKGTPVTNQPKNLIKLYQKPLPISVQKKNDLLKLCRSNIIPVEFQAWYKSPPTSKTVKYVTPEPAAEDSCSESFDSSEEL